MEITAIVMIGAVMGFLVSIGIVRLMAYIPIREFVGVPILSSKVAFITMGLLIFVAVLAGYFPAKRAAALDPVECLRQ